MIRKTIPFILALTTVLWADSATLEGRTLPCMAITTDTVVLRSKPSDKAAKVKCDLYGPSEAGILRKNSTILHKGFTLQVLERSPQKMKVGKWNNYWYKISATNPNSGGPATCEIKNSPAQAWVFGEFLTPEDP